MTANPRPPTHGQQFPEDSSRIEDHVGLDHLRLTFPVREFNEEALEVRTRRAAQGRPYLGSQRVPLGPQGSSSWLWVTFAGHSRWRATLMLNPSRCVDPSGWGLAPVTDGLAALRQAWQDVATLVIPASPLAKASVREVHVSVDFKGVLLPQRYLVALSAVGRTAPRAKSVTYADRPGVESFAIQNVSGGRVSMYDKHIQTNGRAPRGVLRAEIQARKWAEQRGIAVVQDLSVTSAADLFRHHWEWARMGTPITSATCFEHRLRERLGGGRRFATALGIAHCLARGIGTGMCNKSEREYLDIFAEIGFAPMDFDVTDDNIPLGGYLDPEGAREVLHPAGAK